MVKRESLEGGERVLAGCGRAGTVGLEDFDRAILRAVAGIEKKRSILVGAEKEVVAKHEAGHAIVSTAVQIVIPASAAVEKLSIIPRSGGALGCAPLLLASVTAPASGRPHAFLQAEVWWLEVKTGTQGETCKVPAVPI